MAAGAVWYPIHAAAALCGQPSVSGVTVPNATVPVAAAGTAVTITGSNFMALTCNTTANIGGVGLAQNQMSVSNNSITFTAQPGMHGGIQITETGIGGANVSNANIAFYTAPTVSGLSNATPTAAQGNTVSGSGFNFTLPSGYEQISAKYLQGSTTCAGASASLSSDTAIAVSAPGHYCNGALALTISAPSDLGNPSGSQIPIYNNQVGHVAVAASGIALSTDAITAGGTFNVTGSGFGPGGSATLGGAPVTSTWSDTSIGITVPDTAVNNSAIALTRADGSAIAVSDKLTTVTARVDGISPSSAKPGDAVTVSGGGFGTTAGTVSLASASATVSSWSPTSITFTVPSAGQTGQLTIAPVDTGAPATEPSLTVTHPVTIQPGTGGAPGASGSSGSSAANSKPLTPAQLEQVTQALSAPPPPLPPAVVGGTPPPIPPSHPTNGPVALSLKSTSTTAKPGKSVPFTVTLLAYGRPVGDAPVQMVVAYEPAPDALITPMSGVTDAKGQFHGTIRLSRTPGEMIVLARTGEFSDEVRLVGSTVSAAAVGSGHATGVGALQNSLPYAVVALAALLLIVGIGIRIWLWVGSTDSVRAALVRERFRGMTRGARRFLARHVVQAPPEPASRRDVQPRGNAASEVDVPAEGEPTLVLGALGGDTAPDQAKERISVGP
ncbi:MAG: IPT/TIG domain-containing protein [Candidatus Dormibacteraeota bacterium]|nr:IPT/TIG domain-containing protein [Candidatus Dormibacteraeota bacterium]